MEVIHPMFMVDPSTVWVTYSKTVEVSVKDQLLNAAMKVTGSSRVRTFDRPVCHLPNIGEVVIIWCREARRYARAEVQNVFIDEGEKQNSTATVFYIDYGTSGTVRVVHISAAPEEFKGPGRAVQILLPDIVPITKLMVSCPKAGFKLADRYVPKWDTSTYSFVANLLTAGTQFFLQPATYETKMTTSAGNKIIYGDIFIVVDGILTSLVGLLAKDRYGLVNKKKFQEMFIDDPSKKVFHLSVGPAKPVHAETWQIDINVLLPVNENFKVRAPEGKIGPFESSPEEIEAAKAREIARALAITEIPMNLNLKKTPAPLLSPFQYTTPNMPTFNEMTTRMNEEVQLKNYVKELAGAEPTWEELSSTEPTVVHFRAADNPQSVYVMVTANVPSFKHLNEQISDYVKRYWRLQGQFRGGVGTYCLALYPPDGTWYRARVTELQPSYEGTVFFVDVGDSLTLNVACSTMPISRALLLMIPFQAVECRLMGVPVSEGDLEDKLVDAIYEFCVDEMGIPRDLEAKVHEEAMAQHSGGKVYTVGLTYYTPEVVMSLNDDLLKLTAAGAEV